MGSSLHLATTVDNRLFSSSACWFDRKTHWWSFTRKVCTKSSFAFKTILCRIIGLIDLVASTEIHLTDYQLWEMPTTLKITGESSYVALRTCRAPKI